MEPNPADDARDLVKALSASGFPMQTAVASAIRALGMYDIQEELAWRHPDGSDRFLDMAAVGAQVHVLIECKKTLQDKFVFLLPEEGEPALPTPLLHGIYLCQVQDSTLRGAVAWGRLSAVPTTYNSMFCVTRSSSSNRLLESDVQPLVRASEAYALDRYKNFRPQQHQAKSVPCVPVLITNAPLFVARYRPGEVSLESGVYEARTEHLSPIKLIRFYKQFTTTFDIEARVRTVFVAHTSAIVELLKGLGSADVVKGRSERIVVS